MSWCATTRCRSRRSRIPWPQAISLEFLKRMDFATETEARNYVRCHAAEVALREMFAGCYEVSMK